MHYLQFIYYTYLPRYIGIKLAQEMIKKKVSSLKYLVKKSCLWVANVVVPEVGSSGSRVHCTYKVFMFKFYLHTYLGIHNSIPKVVVA